MRKHWTMPLAVLAVVGLLAALPCAMVRSAHADAISINMDRYGANVAAMEPAEIAGLEAVANWNAFDPVDGFSAGPVTPVDDSGGAVGGGFDVVRTSGGGRNSWNTGGTNNRKMFGDFSNPGVLTISNIPYAKYDLIVYSKLWNTADQFFDIGGAEQIIANDVAGMGNENPQSFDNPSWSNGVFADGVHYTKFAELTSGSLVLTHDSMSSFQIVKVPLPTLTSIAGTNWGVATTWNPNQIPTIDEAVVVDGETVTVAAPGVAGELTVSSGAVNINAGQSLTISSAVDIAGGAVNIAATGELSAGKVKTTGLGVVAGSILTVNGELTINSAFDVTGVTLNLASANNILAPGGTLTNSGNLTMGGLTAKGGSLNLGGNTLNLATLNVEADLNMGADLLAVSGTLNAVGGTLTVNNAVTPQILAYKGGSLAGVPVVPTVGYEVHNATVTDNLTAPVPLVAASGTCVLTGTNTYTGKTTVSGGATLKVADHAVNIGAGHLELNNGYLASSGTVARNIGTGNGELSIAGNFGFTADGADLTVTLDGGAELQWNTHFGGRTLLLNQLGSHTVEITNDIDLQGGRTFNFGGSRGTADVGLKLSGDLSNGSIRVDEHRSGSNYGVFWLAGSDLSGVTSYRLRTAGIVRFVDEATGLGNLPPDPAFGEIYFAQIETNGALQLRGNKNLGNTTPGYICLNWGGGFSAYGGDLEIHLIGEMEEDPFDLTEHSFPSGFGEMYLNSPYSDGVVTIKGDIQNGIDDGHNRANWPIRIFNNTDTDADYARLEGNWSMEGMRIQANNSDGGIVELVEGFTITTDNTQGQAGEFRVENSAEFRLNGTLDASDGGNVIIRASGRLSGTGTVIGLVDVQGGTTIAPGNSGGTLTIDGDLQLAADSTYECEVDDLIAVVGDLDIPVGDVTVELLDSEFKKGGTMPIFTYGSFDDALGNLVLDPTALVDGGLLSQAEADALFLTDVANEILLNGLSGASPALPGDANDSGFVDDDDLAILLSNWESDPGTITTWELGDFTVDTDVDDDDLAVLLGNWTGSPPGGAAVPEPATLALLGLGGLAMLRRRRK